MITDFVHPRAKRIVVYPTPIDTRVGLDRLRALCEAFSGIGLDRGDAVLFYNAGQTTLVLYQLDDDGDRSTSKKLERGRFLRPVPAPGEPFAVVDVGKARALFR